MKKGLLKATYSVNKQLEVELKIKKYETSSSLKKYLFEEDLLNENFELIKITEKKKHIKAIFTINNTRYCCKFKIINGNVTKNTIETYPIYKEITKYADIIFDLYENHGKTETKISKSLGISQTSVSRILNKIN